MTTERTYYSDDEGVRITGTRAIFNNTTYSMANISSIRTNEVPPKRGGAIFTIILGIILLVIGASGDLSVLTVIGIIVLLIGILWVWKASGEYHLMITSTSGEVSALKSTNKDYINKVTHAMNEAIIHRG